MQDHVVTMLLTDVRPLIRDLGKDGGMIGPSIYDTAQVVRLAPPASGVWQTLDWLVEQQQPDGGWGDPAIPRARDVPTLAALLALHTYATRAQDRKIVQSGLAFLRRHMSIWAGPLPDELPVGIELLLPRLLEEAEAAGLSVPREPYAALIGLGQYRRRLLANLPVRAGTPPAHVWEAWGTDPDPNLIDGSGGVGNSPAATAAWLRATARRADLADARANAHCYLREAAAATGVSIPGVVPTVWPIPRFEQSFGLYALLIGGLLDHPQLQDVIQPQLDALAQALRPAGLGMSDYFLADGDDTAAALAILRAAGRSAQIAILKQFAHNDHFCAYAGELQPSLSVTAHAIHGLHLAGHTCGPTQMYMLERQLTDGRWRGDKWNGSWLYTTSQIVIALADTPHIDALRRAVGALVVHQHTDGGWGDGPRATVEETAYGVLALRTLVRHGIEAPDLQQALARAEQWLLRHYRPFDHSYQPCWLGKESYMPQRIVRMIQLAATFPLAELPTPLQLAESSHDPRNSQDTRRDLAVHEVALLST
jgi:squalene-hopene cyclase-like protein